MANQGVRMTSNNTVRCRNVRCPESELLINAIVELIYLLSGLICLDEFYCVLFT